MKPKTEKDFIALRSHFRRYYGVKDPGSMFTVQDPLETRLHAAIQDSDEFLKAITMLPVTDRDGQVIELGIYSPIAKRTDTTQKDRTTTRIGGPDGLKYHCTLSEFDIHLSYETLDSWSHLDNFHQLYIQAVTRRIALDRIQIGWIGKSMAIQSDPVKNPDRSDMNIGWLQLLRTHNPINYLTESTPGTGKITIGQKGDYKNLDNLVFDVLSMIDKRYQNGSEVAIIGRDLIADSVLSTLSEYGQQPSEKKEASRVEILEGSFGTLPALVVPGFPGRGVCVTDPKNLCLFYQDGKTRRKQENNPKRNRVEEYLSCNDAYSISEINAIAAIEADNVEFAA